MRDEVSTLVEIFLLQRVADGFVGEKKSIDGPMSGVVYQSRWLD
jgi:hypothetical protein